MLSAQEDFEHLIEDLCENELGPESLVQMRGRRGQRQQGIDVYGQPPGLAGAYVGYQCKAHAVDNPLTKAKVWDEVNKAKTFPLSPFVKLVIAITHPRNTTEQDVISTVSDENQRQGSFPVD
jgi:cellulose synthase operon protein C